MTALDAPGLSYSSASERWVLAVSVPGSGIAALDAAHRHRHELGAR